MTASDFQPDYKLLGVIQSQDVIEKLYLTCKFFFIISLQRDHS